MEKELRSKIDKAKSLASACKVNKEADDITFATSTSGVFLF